MAPGGALVIVLHPSRCAIISACCFRAKNRRSATPIRLSVASPDLHHIWPNSIEFHASVHWSERLLSLLGRQLSADAGLVIMLDECGLSNVKGRKRTLSVIIDPSTG